MCIQFRLSWNPFKGSAPGALSGRDSDELEELIQPNNPTFLRLIEQVIKTADASAKAISLCGDMGGDPRYLPLLLQRGLRTVSIPPSAIASSKATVAQHSVTNGGTEHE